MCTMQQKKLLIMNILDIFKKYTDENHRLIQKEIVEILDNEYDMKTDRKSVKRNLMNLIEFGYDIEYSEYLRVYKNKQGKEIESLILSDFYLNRDFSDGELKLLIDSLMFSKYIPYAICMELVEKLEGLSNIYFRPRVKHISTFTDNSVDNKQLFYTIYVLDEANEMSMLQFVKSFAPDVVVLEPNQLRDKIKNDLERSLKNIKFKGVHSYGIQKCIRIFTL